MQKMVKDSIKIVVDASSMDVTNYGRDYGRDDYDDDDDTANDNKPGSNDEQMKKNLNRNTHAFQTGC